MIPKPFDQVDKQDIDRLVAEGRPERRTIEYKQLLPGNGAEDRKEFLADVSSFANAAGGDLLYGVIDKRENGKPTGIPESAPGVAVPNPGATLLQLEQVIRANIDPPIPGLQTKAIEGFPAGRVVILIRIPKSYILPHMVKQGDWFRFYSRTSNGKMPLGTAGELRAAFALSDSLPEKIRRFRADRLATIVAEETPIRLRPAPKVILHLLPIRSLDRLTQVNLVPYGTIKALLPLYARGGDSRFNIDGVVFYAWGNPRSDTYSYVQLFRNSAVEAVDSRILERSAEEEKFIPAGLLEKELICGLRSYLDVVQDLGVGTPVVVLVTLTGVKGYRIYHDRRNGEPIDRDTLFLPDVLVEDFAAKTEDKLRDVFDALWQAAGWVRCINYDEQGRWIRTW